MRSYGGYRFPQCEICWKGLVTNIPRKGTCSALILHSGVAYIIVAILTTMCHAATTPATQQGISQSDVNTKMQAAVHKMSTKNCPLRVLFITLLLLLGADQVEMGNSMPMKTP